MPESAGALAKYIEGCGSSLVDGLAQRGIHPTLMKPVQWCMQEDVRIGEIVCSALGGKRAKISTEAAELNGIVYEPEDFKKGLKTAIVRIYLLAMMNPEWAKSRMLNTEAFEDLPEELHAYLEACIGGATLCLSDMSAEKFETSQEKFLEATEKITEELALKVLKAAFGIDVEDSTQKWCMDTVVLYPGITVWYQTKNFREVLTFLLRGIRVVVFNGPGLGSPGTASEKNCLDAALKVYEWAQSIFFEGTTGIYAESRGGCAGAYVKMHYPAAPLVLSRAFHEIANVVVRQLKEWMGIPECFSRWAAENVIRRYCNYPTGEFLKKTVFDKTNPNIWLIVAKDDEVMGRFGRDEDNEAAKLISTLATCLGKSEEDIIRDHVLLCLGPHVAKPGGSKDWYRQPKSQAKLSKALAKPSTDSAKKFTAARGVAPKSS